MEHQTETGGKRKPIIDADFDLDNRKLVLVFLGFLVICGCFFVAGYAFGKRFAQSPPTDYADAGAAGNLKTENKSSIDDNNRIIGGEPVMLPSSVVETPGDLPSTVIEPPAAPQEIAETAVAVSIPAFTAADPVNDPGPQPKETQGKTTQTTAKKESSTAKPAASAKTVYSVQVAAFRARGQAEETAKEVKSKGFEPRIEQPQKSGDYYRIKIGSFATRAEAVDLANRLQKNGFETMITVGENKVN